MDTVPELLDKCMEIRSLALDADLARLLGVRPSAVSNWRHARAYPDAVTCARISDVTGQPLGRVIGIVGEARALRSDEKKVWRRLATTAILAVSTLALMLPSTPAKANAESSRAERVIHYAHSAMRQIRRIFALQVKIWATA